MHKKTLAKSLRRGALILSLAAVATAFGQGVTTSAMNGTITDKDGKPLAGASVTILHEPTNTKVVTVTRSNGQYTVSGLQVGGPYTVTVSSSAGTIEPKHEVYLSLDAPAIANFSVGTSDVVTMDALKVTTGRDSLFDASKMGTGQSFNAAEIADVPSIRRDVQDIANTDTRIGLTVSNGSMEWSMSAQGQNSRYNSFLVDGMQSNDPFGLNSNGTSSLRSPVPMDALASVSLDLNPYDVTHTAFTGVLMDAVTKSGTNQFHGSVYTYYMGASMRQKNPLTQVRDQFQDHTSGFTFGGPIVKNKVFFFIAYENFDHIQSAPNQNFLPNSADVAAIIAAAKTYGYDAGSLTGSNETKQNSFLGKLDWNIIDGQHLTFTYRHTKSQTPNYADYSGSTYTSLSNHWYNATRVTDNYSIQLNSQWTPDFRTDAGAAIVKYNGTAKPNGSPFPEVYINGVTGTNLSTGATVTNGQIDLGTNYSYQLNQLYTKNANGHLYGEYSLGDHTIKAGGDVDKTQYFDAFVQYYYGRYAFASVSDFVKGMANYVRYQQASPGFTIADSYADYSATNAGLLIQDTYKPNQSLTLTGGLRFDYPYIPAKPIFLQSFYNTFGFTNTTNGSGNSVLAPRFGFNYRLPKNSVMGDYLGGRKLQIRGGVGLFQGTNPAVWIANAFDTMGALNTVTKGSSTTSTTSGTYTFNPDPLYVQSLPAPSAPTANINVIDPDFHTPSSWKANLAVDHALPWLDTVLSVEANFIKVNHAIYYNSLNLKQYGTAPDGRIMYVDFLNATTGKYNASNAYLYSNFAAVLDMQNTNKGGAEEYTVSVRRTLKNNWGFSAGYTHTHATEVQPLTSSVATSSNNYRAVYNPNDQVAHNSAYAVPDKFAVSATRQFHFFHLRDSATRISGTFRAQTGHAFSWVFYGDANGDGVSGNDSFYVPTGPNDSKVTWADATQEANFFAFVNANKDLKKYMGQVIPANSSYNSWQHTIDLHIEQDLPLFHGVKCALFADCLNFANLLSKKWGVVNGLDWNTSYSGYNRSVAQANYNPTTNQYAYTFTSSTLGTPINFTDLSRYQIQVGAKVSF